MTSAKRSTQPCRVFLFQKRKKVVSVYDVFTKKESFQKLSLQCGVVISVCQACNVQDRTIGSRGALDQQFLSVSNRAQSHRHMYVSFRCVSTGWIIPMPYRARRITTAR